MRAPTLFPILLLAGCLGPNISDICFTNDLARLDLCDVDYDAEDEEDILEECNQAAGYAQGKGCAGEALAVAKCFEDVYATNPDCEDIAEEEDVCSYEVGRLNGCLDRGF